MIKLVKLAEIVGLDEVIKKIVNGKLDNHRDQLKYSDKDRYFSLHGHEINLLKSILTKPGYDKLKTELRCLRYKSFRHEVNEYGEYLVGHTTNVFVSKFGYDLGEYEVYILVKDLIYGVAENMHLIPMLMPLTRNRHMHHIGGYPEEYKGSRIVHPLQWRPKTCFSGFGEMMLRDVQECDIPNFFRNVRFYLERYNPTSPYGNNSLIENLPFAKKRAN